MHDTKNYLHVFILYSFRSFYFFGMPIFSRSRTPREIVNHINECLTVLSNPNKSERDRKKAQDDLGKSLGSLKELLTEKSAGNAPATTSAQGSSGLSEEKARISEILAEVSHDMFENGVMKLLLMNLDKVDFEVRRKKI